MLPDGTAEQQCKIANSRASPRHRYRLAPLSTASGREGAGYAKIKTLNCFAFHCRAMTSL